MMIGAFEDAAFGLDVGATSGVVETEPIATYEYRKHRARLWMQVFPMLVERVAATWQEESMRRRRWASLHEAIEAVASTDVRAALERFAARFED